MTVASYLVSCPWPGTDHTSFATAHTPLAGRNRFRCSDFGLDDQVIESLFLLLDTNMDGEIDLDEFIGGWQVFQERSGVAPAALPEPVEIELSSLEAAVLRLHTETTHRLVYMKEERRNILPCKFRTAAGHNRWGVVTGQVKNGLEQGSAVLICDPSERAAGFLAYNAVCFDCKGTFVLDKIHGKPPREIKEKAVGH